VTERVYKFLARGARGPITGFSWPQPAAAPGAWVEAEGPLGLCLAGAHVCRTADLAFWLHDELWELDADGDQLEGVDCLVVRRARLVRRIDAWHDGGAARFAEACTAHAAALAQGAPAARDYLADAEASARAGLIAISAHCAALAVRVGSPPETAPTYRGERRWQGAWIASHVIGG
jgi:hypothetical protein